MPYFGNNPSPLLLNTVAQNGKEMTLDADADTSITADTDDQIDIKIAGADDFQFTANTFTAQSGSTIAAQALTATTITTTSTVDINGNELILDADADTSITADTDDQIDIRISGADDFQLTANTFTALSGSSIATNTITETTSGSGVTIDSVLLKDGGIDVNGNEIILDADADTSITADTDDQIDFKTAGTDRLSIDSSGFIKHFFTSDNSTTAEGLFINNRQNTTGNNASLIFSNDSGGRKKAALAHIDTGSYGAGDLVFALDSADSGAVHLTNDEKMRITSAGYVTKPSQVYVFASGNGTRHNQTSANTEQSLDFSESTDNTNSFNTSGGIFTAPVAGRYFIHYYASTKSNTSYIQLYVKHNSSIVATDYNELPNNSNDWSAQQVTVILNLSASDTVQPFMVSGGTNAYSLENYYRGASIYLLG